MGNTEQRMLIKLAPKNKQAWLRLYDGKQHHVNYANEVIWLIHYVIR